jgi:Carboxypeptidase regulatory-like domain/TonB dependent receptor
MTLRSLVRLSTLLLFVPLVPPSFAANSWTATVLDASGKPVAGAAVHLHATSGGRDYKAKTSAAGKFHFESIEPGLYAVSVSFEEKTWTLPAPYSVTDGALLNSSLTLSGTDQSLTLRAPGVLQASGGEHLSSGEVSSLPLNERDFSKLLLLAAGTMTDTNGAANFTQQFAVNGQRGTASVFAMDGSDTSDPELGGATFSNFNVDAIEEVQSSSGVMPAELGHGAAGFTNVLTKPGTNFIHGSAFEFIRNAALDARNFFDHPNAIDPRRIPPFARNEFGVTIGGPVALPGVYNGRDKTFFFGEYQGFRQVLGTTQVIPVPTEQERQGIDTLKFSDGTTDTLTVPVSAAIAPLLARYPLPNLPNGPYGDRTYATSSKVATDTDQFSVRIDHRISDKTQLFARFSLNQVRGPTTNPDQTAIDPSFGVNFFDHQRNGAGRYTRNITPNLTSSTSFGFIRSTPIFPASNHTDIALGFGDGLFQPFNSADGSIFGSYGLLYQFKQDMAYTHGAHAFKWGAEIRWNRDSTVFGTNPSGSYTFGGGTAYSPVFLPSASSTHDIQVGDPLPDSLTGLLTATPYSYTITALHRLTPCCDKFDIAAVRREAYNFYFQDTWKATPRFTLTYGLRYELNSRIKEGKTRTSVMQPLDASGNPTSYLAPGAAIEFLYNPQPIYPLDKKGFGPRLAADYAITKNTMLHAGGAITTILPNLWQDNFVTGGIPFVFQPFLTARPGTPVPFSNAITPITLPEPYTTSGELLFASGDTSKVAANTPIDLERFQNDLAAITPGNQIQLFSTAAIDRHFRNGYIGSWTAGFDHDFHFFKLSTSYVGTAGIHLPAGFFPNGYGGAEPGFAPFTQFNSSGQATGGYSSLIIMTNSSHSSYHSVQTSVRQDNARIGLNFQASYTFAKSLDDTSAVLGGLPANAGAIIQAPPQDPSNPEDDKGPSTFDMRHAFSLSVFQALPFDHIGFLDGVSKRVTSGWQLLNITSFSSGAPFSVYSGIQQTGVGINGADRPDLVSKPDFSTSRSIREDYFGLGTENASFFSIPVGVTGGTGPNQGRFGTLGRNTFRGPAFHQFDFGLIKDTPFGSRGTGDLGILEFRAEFFNLFNIVNFGLPSNTVRGTGFGLISRTAGTSRQIQFSLKLIF